MRIEFGEVILMAGMRCIYCGPCPIKPELLSIVIPVNDISNPLRVLSAHLVAEKKHGREIAQ